MCIRDRYLVSLLRGQGLQCSNTRYLDDILKFGDVCALTPFTDHGQILPVTVNLVSGNMPNFVWNGLFCRPSKTKKNLPKYRYFDKMLRLGARLLLRPPLSPIRNKCYATAGQRCPVPRQMSPRDQPISWYITTWLIATQIWPIFEYSGGSYTHLLHRALPVFNA